VGVKGGRSSQEVAELLGLGRGEPAARAAIDAVVPEESERVEAPALLVEGVGLGFGQAALQRVGADHRDAIRGKSSLNLPAEAGKKPA
jgi:hypothetical protein